MSSADRYEGKPLVRLLDAYVLRAIGHITADQEKGLAEIAPKLAAIYGVDGAWHEILAAQMKFPESFPQKIQRIWQESSEKVKRDGFTPDPSEFTMQFVDVYFKL